jgi:hypothetical protein
VSHSVGARNTTNTTGPTSSPKHASTGSITPQTVRSCPIVEGLVGKSTPPQPINRDPPPKVTFVEPVHIHTPDSHTTPPCIAYPGGFTQSETPSCGYQGVLPVRHVDRRC